jgi:hypothetical protein
MREEARSKTTRSLRHPLPHVLPIRALSLSAFLVWSSCGVTVFDVQVHIFKMFFYRGMLQFGCLPAARAWQDMAKWDEN